MHWDHVSDVSLFPAQIPLIVGPGFKDAFFPGWPEDEKGVVNSDAWNGGRDVIELNFRNNDARAADADGSGYQGIRKLLMQAPRLQIAGLYAIDIFADGSFYILDAPGHTVAHVCALARTDASSTDEEGSEFVLLAADALHHSGELRPNRFSPLPQSVITQSKLASDVLARTQLKADVSQKDGRPLHVHPFYTPTAYNTAVAQQTLEKLAALDARSDVLTLSAHEYLEEEDGIKFFPSRLNRWREGFQVRDRLFWRFLKDFKSK
jgi:hypothetical protein